MNAQAHLRKECKQREAPPPERGVGYWADRIDRLEPHMLDLLERLLNLFYSPLYRASAPNTAERKLIIDCWYATLTEQQRGLAAQHRPMLYGTPAE